MIEINWPQHRRHILNICLFWAALIVAGAGAAAALLVSQDGRLATLSLLTVVPLIICAAWLLLAYLAGRLGRMALAGGMLMALLLAWLASGLYLLPQLAPALWSLVVVPVALAALLLPPRAVAVTGVAGVAILVTASILPTVLPPPALGLALSGGTLAGPVGAGLSVLLVTLLAGTLSRTVATLRAQAHQNENTYREQADALQSAQADREAALAQTQQLQSQLTTLAQYTSDGLVAVDVEGRLVSANRAATEMWTSVAEDDLPGQPLERVRETLAGTTPGERLAEILPLPVEPQGDSWFTHMLLDHREQARFVRLRAELLSLLTDEMRNPLTSMATALDLTLGQANLPEDVDRVLIGARHSGQRLIDLVSVVSEMILLEQDPTVLHRNPTTLRRLLEAGIAQTAPLAQQGAVTVSVEYGSESTVLVDAERVQRAFVYLLEYALRHSPPYSTVQIRMERQNGLAIVRVTDQGPALAPAEQAALFDQRALPQRRSVAALGLAFGKLVVERHGGQIWPESTGQGRTFAFSLPET